MGPQNSTQENVLRSPVSTEWVTEDFLDHSLPSQLPSYFSDSWHRGLVIHNGLLISFSVSEMGALFLEFRGFFVIILEVLLIYLFVQASIE